MKIVTISYPCGNISHSADCKGSCDPVLTSKLYSLALLKKKFQLDKESNSTEIEN